MERTGNLLPIAMSEKKFEGGWVFKNLGLGQRKCLRPLMYKVGGVKKGQRYAYVILEWSLTIYIEKSEF